MNVLIFQDLFFYMENIIFLGIIANRSFSLLPRLYRFYGTHAISNQTNDPGHLDTYVLNYMDILKGHNNSLFIMRCIYRFGMYAAHALYKRPSYAIETRWPPRVRGMYAVHTPLAPWIRHGQVLIRDIIRSGIAIHTLYAPHVRYPCAIDTQLIRNTCEIVAPEMFHQTILAILLRICYFFRTPYKRRSVEQGHYTAHTVKR